MSKSGQPSPEYPPVIIPFDRDAFTGQQAFTVIGTGPIGGKAHGLARIKEKLENHFTSSPIPGITIHIPRLTVISTPYFDRFMEMNRLYEKTESGLEDERLVHHFLRADLPPDLVGDLRALAGAVATPLAIRSSSLL